MQNRWYIVAFSLLICLFPVLSGAGPGPLVLSAPGHRVDLAPYLSVFEDPENSLTFSEVRQAGENGAFSPITGRAGFGYSNAGFWFRFSVTNPSDHRFAWLVEYPYPVVDIFEFYTPAPSGYRSHLGGDRSFRDLSAVDFRTPVVPVEIRPGTQTFYFKIHSSGAVVVPLTGWSPKAFQRYKKVDTAVNWLFYGVMLSTVVYCLFIFASMREPVFVWLAVFVAGSCLFILSHTGLGMQYFWPASPVWANLSHPLAVFIAILGALKFTRLFLYTSYHIPLVDSFFALLCGYSLVMIGLSPILPYTLLTQASVVSIGISVVAMIACGCLLLARGQRQARFYLIAWSPFALSALLMGIKSYGFIENNLVTDSTIQISAAFVTFLFSFGLMDKINRFRLDREAAIIRLHRSERNYRMLANNIKDVIWVLDLSSMRITYISPSIRSMVGYTPSEAKQGFSFKDMLPAESAKQAMEMVRQYHPGKGKNESGRGFTIELPTLHKDGAMIWTETTTSFVQGQDGGLVEMVGVTRDVTARHRAEEEKKALEFQLHQSGKLEAMGTLAGGIAHDMNNIIAAILGYTELSIRDAPEGSRLHHRLSRVVKASCRARDLVRQILTFSRQENLEARTIKVGLIVKEILALIRASMPSTIRIVREIRDRDLAVTADPSQIHQIIMNLCSNAGYAMMDKGGTLTVIVEKMVLDEAGAKKYLSLSPGSYVRMVVSDTGRGMEKKVQERIFDPFYTTKPVGEGTGMGLAMVHGIVKNIGGEIEVRSTPGAGSDFHVILPMAADRREREDGDRCHNARPGGSERVLYVDDEPEIVGMAKEMLEDLGYTVTGKTDSPGALALFAADPCGVDLLITDQTMPEMTGGDLIMAVKELRPDLPVILCTGFSEKMPEDAVRETGRTPVLLKPYDGETLALRVRQALDRKTCVSGVWNRAAD